MCSHESTGWLTDGRSDVRCVAHAVMPGQQERVNEFRERVIRTALVLLHMLHRVHELQVPYRVILVVAHVNLRNEGSDYSRRREQ